MTQNDKTVLVVAGGEQNTKPPISTLNLKSVEILDVISNETQWIEGKEKYLVLVVLNSQRKFIF